MIRFPATVMTGLLLLGGTGAAAVTDQADHNAQVLLAQTIERYAGLESFRATLQVTTNFADAEIRQEGVLVTKKGGKVLLRLRDGDSKAWIALLQSDGAYQYQYDSKAKKITRRAMGPEAAAQTPYFFPGFERYELPSTRHEELVRRPQGDLIRVSVALKGAADKTAFHFVRMLVRRDVQVIEEMEFMSAARRTLMKIRFVGVELDQPIDDGEFRWEKPPELAEVPVVDAAPQK